MTNFLSIKCWASQQTLRSLHQSYQSYEQKPLKVGSEELLPSLIKVEPQGPQEEHLIVTCNFASIPCKSVVAMDRGTRKTSAREKRSLQASEIGFVKQMIYRGKLREKDYIRYPVLIIHLIQTTVQNYRGIDADSYVLSWGSWG